MASKRKHSTLTLKDKLEVLKRLDKGETKLATEFNVGKAFVGDINEWMEEDGETAEFLTDDDIAAAVTQEPMEEEGSDDETQCDKKDVVPHADGAAALALRYLEQQPDTTPADVLFIRRWRNYASSKRLSSLHRPQTLDHLEDSIRRVIADIWPQMLEKVIEYWTPRLDYIRASRGSHMPEIIFLKCNTTRLSFE
ncbi:hypothetical protein TNCV_2277321 [Trichonephila clavipes]|nr:hypothetical protein TNCV_2277321 [Trichonephila clavipes]